MICALDVFVDIKTITLKRPQIQRICGLFSFRVLLIQESIVKNQQVLTVILAFIAVVFIWSTTPLAIKWSGEGVGFVSGITGRMLIGAVLAAGLTFMRFNKLSLSAKALHVYTAAALAIFGAMMPVYWGAQYLSSGLISVVFGLTPIFTAFFAASILHENSLTLAKISGALSGIVGLLVIFSEQLSLGENALMGMSAVLLSVVLHSMSAVWIKHIDARLPALMVTTGGLLFSLPLFLLVYILFAEPLPIQLPMRSIWSIVYLGVMGSIVGFVSYYYLLSHLQASTVALITLMTPVTALLLGNVLNNEEITSIIWLGTGLVLLGLILHQWGGFLSKYLCREK
jgi:drug/metabolite transporter (DMT)-like permease